VVPVAEEVPFQERELKLLGQTEDQVRQPLAGACPVNPQARSSLAAATLWK